MAELLGVAFALLAAVCLAGQALTIRVITQRTSPTHVLLFVLVTNAVVFVPLAVLFTESYAVTPTAVVAFATAGIVSTLIGRVFFYSGIERVGAARAEPLKASMPLHATILAVLLLNEAVSAMQFGGVLLIVGGIAVISWDGAARDTAATGTTDWIGLAFPLIGAFLFAVEPIFATIGFEEGTSVLVGLSIKAVAAAGVLASYLALRGDLPGRELFSTDVVWFVLAGIATSGFLLAYYAGLSVSRVSIVVPIMQTSPLLVAIAAALFLRGLERVTPALVVGSTVVVVGAVVVTLFG